MLAHCYGSIYLQKTILLWLSNRKVKAQHSIFVSLFSIVGHHQTIGVRPLKQKENRKALLIRSFNRGVLYSSLLCVLFVIVSTCTLPSVGDVRWGSFCREQFHPSFSEKLHMLAIQENFTCWRHFKKGISKSLIVQLCPHCNPTFFVK